MKRNVFNGIQQEDMCVVLFIEYSCKSRIYLGSSLDSSKASSPGQLTSTHRNTQYTQYTHSTHTVHTVHTPGGVNVTSPVSASMWS